jgi:hypothetical protein
MIEKPTEGNIFISGADPHAHGGAEIPRLRQDVQIIFQNPYGSLNPRKKVGVILEEPVFPPRIAAGWLRPCWIKWACGRNIMIVTRTCFPVGNASVSPSHAP